MKDFADKSWLHVRPRFIPRALDFASRVLLVAAILFLLAVILQSIDARAAGTWTVLLDLSRAPATLDEGQAAHPELGRPLYCISYQERSNEPWNHRFCTYELPQ